MNTLRIPYWIKIGIGILICNMVGLVAGWVTVNAIPEWYAQLNKPFFNPPSWLFGPVWTVLYTLMGISAAAIWDVGIDQKRIKIALTVFGIQLILNGIWSFLFFGFKSPLVAFIEIIFLLIGILFTIKIFRQIKPWTAWLLLPYLLWVVFASVLNFAIYILN